MASTYFLGAPARAPARNRSLLSQWRCQRGSTAFGSYRSCTPGNLLETRSAHCNALRRSGSGQVPERRGADKASSGDTGSRDGNGGPAGTARAAGGTETGGARASRMVDRVSVAGAAGGSGSGGPLRNGGRGPARAG